jgi:chemotaxis protein methyltransferase CheR
MRGSGVIAHFGRLASRSRLSLVADLLAEGFAAFHDCNRETMVQQEFALRDGDFAKISDLVMATTGIVIDDRKRAFIHGRLDRRLRALGLANFREYCRVLDGPDGTAERNVLVDAITTRHTSFFSEPHHFDYLAKTILPAIVRRKTGVKRCLRIWSAGCSTGEEAYTTAMTLCDSQLPLANWDIKILATDLDRNSIAHATTGLYDAERMQSIPTDFRQRFVTLQPDGRTSMNTALRSLITFKQLNLLEEWPIHGPFDIIFCRNVVLSFDKPTQRRLFDRYADILKPDGWLIVGHSESLYRLTDRFEPAGGTVYRRTKCRFTQRQANILSRR